MPASARLLSLAVALVLFLAACQSPPVSDTPPSTAPALASPASLHPRDAFVLLSGGGTPSSNNYSQFVQARAVATWLRTRFPRDATWTFFGVGNREGEPPLLADVYRQIKDADTGLLLDTWLPGSLPDNRPATKENILRTLRAEILPRVRGGGTLYLFVGDHGELTPGKSPESGITLWGLRRDTTHKNGWSPARDSTLTVTDLRNALASGLGAGRVVFVMTQCHSGGFHELGVPREVSPPSTWFTSPPAWLDRRASRLPPRAAGFTATDEASIAAGCDPFPDPDTWFGYERFLPEKLLAHDLLSGAPLAHTTPAPSFAEAHHAAVLIDQTIDKPRSSSEHYLERWANLIETKIAHELLLTSRTRAALEAYQSAVDTGRIAPVPDDAAFRETRARFSDYTTRLAAQNPSARPLVLRGTRAQLEKPTASRPPRPPRQPRRDDTDETSSASAAPSTPTPSSTRNHVHAPSVVGNVSRTQSQLWRDTLRPAWNKAVAARQVPDLPDLARPFELALQPLETRRPIGFADDWSSRSLTELYWFSTYATPAKFNPATAAAVTQWAAQRRTVILAWAARSPDVAVRDAAAKFGPEFRRPRTPPPPPHDTSISLQTAAARALYNRRVLAAWAFLLALDHHPALTELATLRTLERTPLPPLVVPPAAPLERAAFNVRRSAFGVRH